MHQSIFAVFLDLLFRFRVDDFLIKQRIKCLTYFVKVSKSNIQAFYQTFLEVWHFSILPLPLILVLKVLRCWDHQVLHAKTKIILRNFIRFHQDLVSFILVSPHTFSESVETLKAFACRTYTKELVLFHILIPRYYA